jgi:hypothetical protein
MTLPPMGYSDQLEKLGERGGRDVMLRKGPHHMVSHTTHHTL